MHIFHASNQKTINAPAENAGIKTIAVDVKKSDIRKQARKSMNPLLASDAGLTLFVEVIAAIFIPPLAIYIKDHHTNKWFWITLLLCLLGGGFSFIYIGVFGLFWLAAIIIALMNVFDML